MINAPSPGAIISGFTLEKAFETTPISVLVGRSLFSYAIPGGDHSLSLVGRRMFGIILGLPFQELLRLYSPPPLLF